MAHYAELDKNNIVLRVIVVDNYDCLSDQIKQDNPTITKDLLRSKSDDSITACILGMKKHNLGI